MRCEQRRTRVDVKVKDLVNYRFCSECVQNKMCVIELKYARRMNQIATTSRSTKVATMREKVSFAAREQVVSVFFDAR